MVAGYLCLQARSRWIRFQGDARGRWRPADVETQGPGDRHHRPAAERAALCQPAQHHEGEEEADRRQERFRLRRRSHAASRNPQDIRTAGIADPIGDTTDGEAKAYLGDEAPSESATEETPEVSDSEPSTETDSDESEGEDADPEFIPKPRPPAKLERLQKILSQAGVASRRKAEEMIEQGRVQVN